MKRIILSFIATLLLFLSVSLFKDLFVNPLLEYIQGDRLVEFAIFIVSTIILVYLFHRSVPWFTSE